MTKKESRMKGRRFTNKDQVELAVLVCYCNAGDSYAATVLLCHKRGRYLITSWGDYVEKEGL